MQQLEDAGADSPATDQTDLIRLLIHDKPLEKRVTTEIRENPAMARAQERAGPAANKMHLLDLRPGNQDPETGPSSPKQPPRSKKIRQFYIFV